jgi:VCBS repeat-containing protein
VDGKAALDGNGNGIFEPGLGEAVLPGVGVTLLDADGNELDATTTDGDGNYDFGAVPYGAYQVRFDRPSGLRPSPQHAAGAAPDADSDADMGTLIAAVTLTESSPDSATETDALFRPNNPPVAVPDAYEAAYRTPVSGNVLGNDSDPDGDALTAALTTALAHGLVSLAPDGSFTYTPADGFSGTETFTYTAADGHGGAATATVTVTVDPPTDSSGGGSGTVSGYVWADQNADGLQGATEDGVDGVTVQLLAPDGGVVGTAATAAGSVYTFTGVGPGSYRVRVLLPDGGYTFTTPDAGPDDTDSDVDSGGYTPTFTLTDGDHVVLDAGLIPPAPTTGGDSGDGGGGSGGSGGGSTATIRGKVFDDGWDFDGVTYDLDGFQSPDRSDAGYAVEVQLLNASGIVVATTTSDTGGGYTFSDVAPGSYRVQFGLPTPDGVTYFFTTEDAGDDTLGSDADAGGLTGTVTVGVGNAVVLDAGIYWVSSGDDGDTFGDLPPVAVDDVVSAAYQTGVTGNVLANDSDPDGDALTATLTTLPANGSVTLAPDGSFTYTPAAGFSGADTFTYTATDTHGGTATATVTITVVAPDGSGGNSPPVAVNDSYATAYQAVVTGNVLANDSDPDGDTLTATLATAPPHGTVTFGVDGSVLYVPAFGFSGTDTFTYTAADGLGGTATATVTITVSASSGSGGDSSGGSGGSPAVVWVGPASQAVAEGSSGGVWVFRSGGDTTQPLTVNLAIGVDGAADPLAAWDTDYTLAGPSGGTGTAALGATGGTVTFGAGETAEFLPVSALTDALVEGTEGFRVAVLTGGGYAPGSGGSGSGTAAEPTKRFRVREMSSQQPRWVVSGHDERVSTVAGIGLAG